MPVEIQLTERDQWTLTIALHLENEGYADAARFLRHSIVPLRPIWKLAEQNGNSDLKHVDWAELFRRHRGSLSPMEKKT